MAVDKKQARELLLKSRLYRLLAIVFAGLGLIGFLVLYVARAEANVMNVLKDPFMVVFAVLVFLPAFVLSNISSKAQTDLEKMMAGPADKKDEKADSKPAEKAAEKPAGKAKAK